jgi:hypothetical protein
VDFEIQEKKNYFIFMYILLKVHNGHNVENSKSINLIFISYWSRKITILLSQGERLFLFRLV